MDSGQTASAGMESGQTESAQTESAGIASAPASGVGADGVGEGFFCENGGHVCRDVTFSILYRIYLYIPGYIHTKHTY